MLAIDSGTTSSPSAGAVAAEAAVTADGMRYLGPRPSPLAFLYEAALVDEIFQAILQRPARNAGFHRIDNVCQTGAVRAGFYDLLYGCESLFRYPLCHDLPP